MFVFSCGNQGLGGLYHVNKGVGLYFPVKVGGRYEGVFLYFPMKAEGFRASCIFLGEGKTWIAPIKA